MPHVVALGRTDNELEVAVNQRGTEATLAVEIKNASGEQILDFGNPTLYTILISWNAEGNPEYVGEAAVGSGTSDSVWRIKNIKWNNDNNPTSVKWADGDTSFNNVWDDRASLDYS